MTPTDPVSTNPPTEPLGGTLADRIPAAARAWVYALLGVWVPIFLVWVGSGDPPSWVAYVTAGISGAGFGQALANVPVLRRH